MILRYSILTIMFLLCHYASFRSAEERQAIKHEKYKKLTAARSQSLLEKLLILPAQTFIEF